jgi:hypothetical protein
MSGWCGAAEYTWASSAREQLAVKQPTKFDFIVNFTIAKARKTIAESFILHADEASNNSVFCCAA